MKLILHSNQFTERGDSVDMLSMQKNLKKYLNIEAVLTFPKTIPSTSIQNNEMRILEARNLGSEIYQYTSRRDLLKFVEQNQITHNYVFSDGVASHVSYVTEPGESPILGDTTHITRAVFRNFDPHGDLYIYVSEWLFNWAKRKNFARGNYFEADSTFVSWLPHMVDPQIGNGSELRDKLKIPQNAKIIGRIGGFDQFDDNVAHRAVLSLLEKEKDIYVVAVNTYNFGTHSRLIYVPFLSRDEVWDFYAMSDVLINGRLMGESFGFSIVEPLSVGKPVLAPSILRNPRMDLHGFNLLRNLRLSYHSEVDLVRKIKKQLSDPIDSSLLTSKVNQFLPESVIRRFESQLLLKKNQLTM